MYKIVLEKKVIKFLEKHKTEKVYDLFKDKLEIISKNPFSSRLDVKYLKGEKDKYRLRIGKYRFLFKIDNDLIIIFFFNVDSRGGIYK